MAPGTSPAYPRARDMCKCMHIGMNSNLSCFELQGNVEVKAYICSDCMLTSKKAFFLYREMKQAQLHVLQTTTATMRAVRCNSTLYAWTGLCVTTGKARGFDLACMTNPWAPRQSICHVRTGTLRIASFHPLTAAACR